jgi:predicted ChrR family anti-sigma factor
MTLKRAKDTPPGSGHPNDASREAAALHALGALPPEEARAFEAHLAEGCAACAEDRAAFQRVVADLALASATGPAPPPALREKLIARIEEERWRKGTQVWKGWKEEPEKAASPGLHIVRSGEGDWQPTAAPGVTVKPLSVDAERRYVTMLIRMEPGSSYPRHRHSGVEECFVLEGELRVGDEVLRAGDFQRADERSVHAVQSTDRGCLLLITSSQDDDLL